MTPTTAERLARAARRAVELWGAESQWRMVQEEAGELVAEVNRFDRGRSSVAQLAEEIADVEIVTAQARVLLGGDAVEQALGRKLARLEARISKAESARG